MRNSAPPERCAILIVHGDAAPVAVVVPILQSLQPCANNRVYAECAERAERDCAAVIPLRKKQSERNVRIARGSDEWRRLYRRRSAVEREFGNLKHNFGLAFLRVRGIERVRLHADTW